MTRPPGNVEPDLPPKKATLLRVVRIVVSGLFMIGRSRDYVPAAPTIDPVRLIIVALIGTVLLVATLVLLAAYITR